MDTKTETFITKAIKKHGNLYDYTNVIYVKVGQEITLPVDPSWKQEDYVFLRTFDKYFAEDISS